jgi:hypothetical protein
MRFRAGNFLSLETDQVDDPVEETLVPEYY